MQQCELIALIEQTAPLHHAASWDHSGIQVASGRERITHLAVCLDPAPDSVRAALAAGADMILAHHPLSMSPRYPDKLDAYHDVVSLLIRADVPLYSAHTSLDVNPEGPVGWAARELGLLDLRVLEPADGDGGFGFGLCGTLPAPLSGEAILARLEPWLKEGQRTLAGPDAPDAVTILAICPGSGGSMIEAASKQGATLMLTGDVKYHVALESPISVIDVGHFALEEEMMRRFAATLAESVSVTFIPGRDPLRPLKSCNVKTSL